MPKRAFDYVALRAIFDATPGKSKKARMAAACAKARCSEGTMGRAINGGEAYRGGGSMGSAKPTGNGLNLQADHPAVIEGRTLFPTRVRAPVSGILKPGNYSAKLGDVITKGEFKGYTIYALSLEERATCPRTCANWTSCYGNNMPIAKRYEAGVELEARIPVEVGARLLDHPAGVAVRLHNLGDFYSWKYVYLWRELVEQHDKLMVFGFTARDPAVDPIGRAIAHAVRELWPRFAIRFSDGDHDRCTTVTIDEPGQGPEDALICPGQATFTPAAKQPANCGACAFCWSSTRRVAFLRH